MPSSKTSRSRDDRKAVRVNQVIDVYMDKNNDFARLKNGTLINFSSSGARLCLVGDFSEGEEFYLFGHPKYLNAVKVRIAWVNKESDGSSHLGVEVLKTKGPEPV